MRIVRLALLGVLLSAGCGGPEPHTDNIPTVPADYEFTKSGAPTEDNEPERVVTLTEARRGFKTKLVRKEADKHGVPEPPPNLFRVVRYSSPAGSMSAYLSQSPSDGAKHPAIIWLFGGFNNGIGQTAWAKQDAINDQSASAFRKAGIVMMYPSLRGGNGSAGYREAFFGEVNDVLAAADFLAKQDFVDPTRIYLGGHSTGGTLALLCAESTDRFRAVFSFGPVENVGDYDHKDLPFNFSNERELRLRAPDRWLDSIQSPVFVFEGANRPGNIGALESLEQKCTNSAVHFHSVRGADHFSILAPVTQLVATKILRDSGPTTTTTIAFNEKELNDLFAK